MSFMVNDIVKRETGNVKWQSESSSFPFLHVTSRLPYVFTVASCS